MRTFAQVAGYARATGTENRREKARHWEGLSLFKRVQPAIDAPVIGSTALGEPLRYPANIPRIIHQTYSRREALHPAFEKNIARLRKLNPGWEYRFYDDAAIAAFIRKYYGEDTLAHFERINPEVGPARADFFRYLLMYQCGGVYLDLKSTMKTPLDAVLRPSDTFLLSHWNDGQIGIHPEIASARGEFQQWHIVCAPGHPFLKSVIERVMRNISDYDPIRDGVGKSGVLRVTGPIAYTQAIAALLPAHPHRIVDIRKECGFRYNIFKSITSLGAFLKFHKNHYSRKNDPVVLADIRAVRPQPWAVPRMASA